MKLTILLLCFSIFIHFTSAAQSSAGIKGSIADTVSNTSLVNAAVIVLRQKDSTLVSFTRTVENGKFSIGSLPKEKLLLLVTYPGYADYTERFALDGVSQDRDFGKIRLLLKARLLEDVIIKGKAAAIKMKGDTTEFNAAAYQIQPNSKVEDLLKQLPGISIDKDGKITAQGQKVNKVLVDGEEFFGDDPTLVTKNLRADMIDKVQLFDKKSDQSAFTGVDDGKKDKTINLKLKDDKKNGYFGKLEGGVGNDGYYQNQLMFNAFKGKKKLSVYGTLANTGKIGLGWEDNSKYGAGDNLEFGDNYVNINMDGNDGLETFDGRYGDRGIPLARTGGIHYDTKWNGDKESINTNYKIGSLSVSGENNTISQNNLPTGIINTSSNESFDNYMFRQKLDGSYQIKLDTTSTLKISADGMLKSTDTRSQFSTRSLRDNRVQLNESQRSIDNDGTNKIFNMKGLWTKKLNKPRRTLSIDMRASITQADDKGYLKSNNRFYDDQGEVATDSIVDQHKTSLVKSAVYNSNVAYTEPLAKNVTVVLNYGFGKNNSSADRRSFNRGSGGGYTVLDTLFSNNYELDQTSHQGGAVFNYKNAKTTLNAGTKVANVNFAQRNLITGGIFKRNFINWSPQVNYSYKFTPQRAVSVNYNGENTQPSIDQIQPIRVNNDPLNITIGNASLKPSFRNSVNMNFNSYKIVSGEAIYAYASYSRTNNAIVNNINTDQSGKSTLQAINLNDKTTTDLYGYFYGGKKINALDITPGLSANVNRATSYNYINNALNRIQSASYGAAVEVMKSKEKKYYASVNVGPTYTTNESSLQPDVNDNGWGLKVNGYFNVNLPWKLEINSETRYEYRAKTQSFDTDFSRLIWNAGLSKKFLKSDGLKLTLWANDLLNQNVGFSRNAMGNMIVQNSYTTIKRYFMATLSWDFSQMGGSTTKK